MSQPYCGSILALSRGFDYQRKIADVMVRSFRTDTEYPTSDCARGYCKDRSKLRTGEWILVADSLRTTIKAKEWRVLLAQYTASSLYAQPQYYSRNRGKQSRYITLELCFLSPSSAHDIMPIHTH